MDAVHKIISRHAQQAPASLAIVQSSRCSLSYSRLDEIIRGIAGSLRQQGIRATDRVAIVLSDGAELAVAALAVAASAICAPLNPDYSQEEFESRLTILGANAVITFAGESAARHAARSLNIPTLDLVSVPGEAGGFAIVAATGSSGMRPLAESTRPVAGDDPALLLFTSATSARPKLVPLTHRNLCVSAASIVAATELASSDRCLGVMPLFHIHGLSTLFATLIAGGTYISATPFAVERFASDMAEFKPTWYSAAPAIHRAIVEYLQRRPGAIKGNALRFLRSASAPMPRPLLEDVERTLGVPLLEAYGMTEAAPQIASNRLPPAQRKPGSVGKAAGPEIAVMDADGQVLPAGATGEVVIRGLNVTRGYENDPAANTAAFRDGWLRTGDLGYLDADDFLFITGRLKEVINRGGEKVAPRMIEEVLLRHPAVAQAMVFGVADVALGERIAAAIVLNPLAQELLAHLPSPKDGTHPIVASVREFLGKRLAAFEVPSRIVVVDQLPVGPTGKPNRKELAARLQSLVSSDDQSSESRRGKIPARTPVERSVAAIFAEVLRIHEPGIEEDFFDLGGNSLSAAQVVVRLQQLFQIDLPANCLFEYPTVTAIAATIGERLANLAAERNGLGHDTAPRTGPAGVEQSIPRRRNSDTPPLSFAQRRTFFADRIGSGNAYNMSAPLWLTGPLDVGALARSLEEVLRRHEVLRATFHFEKSEPVQRIASSLRVELPVVDLAAFPPEKRAEEAMRLANQEAALPFDLAEGPVLRASLLRLADQEHVLLLTMHHIVSDGWSVRVLQRELHALYPAMCEGRATPLPPLAIQYGDYAAWEQHRLNGGAFDAQIGYWRERLRGVRPMCTFPSDRPRPTAQTWRGAVTQARVGPEVVERLTAVSREHGVTLFMTCIAAFKSLLLRHNGQEDCVIGSALANRSRPELEPLIGFFSNTVVFRTDLSGDPPFTEALGRVRETALGAYANQEVPIDRLAEELRIARDPGCSPFFQVMFVFQNLPALAGGSDGATFELGRGVTARPFQADKPGAKFDLTLYLSPAEGGLETTWLFNEDLFARESVSRLAHQFNVLLEGIAANPARKLSELPLVSPAEQSLPIAAAEQEPSRNSAAPSFAKQFEANAAAMPERLAVASGNERLTYGDLNRRANQLARLLKRQGVVDGTRVGVCLPRSTDYVLAALAVWKAGGTLLPLDARYPAERLAFLLRDANASLLVTESNLCKFDGHAVICLDASGDQIAQEAAPNLPESAPAGGVAYIIYTSGSSGRPKGVLIGHENVAHYAPTLAATLGIVPGDRYLHTASFAFSSSIRQFTVPLACGAAVIVASSDEARDPERLFDLVRRQDVTIVDIVPSFWSACVQVLASLEPAARAAWRQNRLRLILSASEPLPAALVRDWRRLLDHPARLVNMYGQTETTGIVTTWPIPESNLPASTILPIGRPIPGSHACVLDTAQRHVPIGVRGELYIGGKNVGLGYLKQPDLTARTFITGVDAAKERLYRTGDLARTQPDGTIEILGRLDDQMKLRGFRIEPAEIEDAIRAQARVRECAVVLESLSGDESPGTDHRNIGLVAGVVFDSNGSAPNADVPVAQLRAELKQRLPEYMVPQRIVSLERLPRTPSGKVQRSALSSLIAQQPPLAASPQREVPPADRPQRTLPRTDLERRLAQVWCKVLRVEQVYVDENFFDLGGNSLACISVVVEAKQAGVNLTLSQLYQHQTIAELAESAAEGSSDVVPDEAPCAATEISVDRAGKSGKAAPEEGPLITVESLRAYGIEAFTRASLPLEGARVVTEVQLEASLRGQTTHNMVSIPRYARRMTSGKINARAQIRIEHETENSARIDGDNGPGQWISTIAMDVAVRKARQCGIGMVSVRRSNHFGAAGQYVWQATCAGLIGICTTNGPLILAPTGGITPTFGNNPLGVGIPAARHAPILLDIAMSVATRGKIGLTVAEGKPLAAGWILDKQGKPSTNLADLAAGLGVPIGGHKGYGLALVMEVLAGALSGAGFCADHQRDKLHQPGHVPDFGHFFVAIDPARFMPLTEFQARVDAMIEQVKQGPRAEGVAEILVPGEMEMRARERSLRHGVRLLPSTYHSLITYARDVGLSTRLQRVDEP